MSSLSPLVIYAEDEVLNQKLFGFALDDYPHSFEMMYIDNGEELLNYLKQSPDLPAAILLDINMPRLSGLEVLEAIKADSRLDSIVVVMFSSIPEETVRAKSLELGADAFLGKPNGIDGYENVINLLESFCVEKKE